MKKITIISVLCILIDQLIKLVITNNIELNSNINLITNFFSLTYVRNYGAAFSIFYGNRYFLIFVTLIAMIFIYFIFVKNKKIILIETIVYGMLFGGIIGNLIDRFVYGYVIDYLDFNILGYNFPVFNFADICIVISMIFILILSFRGNFDGKNTSK